MQREELGLLFKKAFPQEPLPEMTIHQGQLADQTLTRRIPEEEWEREREKDVGVTWSDLSNDVLLECECALSFLDGPSFVYYLPAYLMFALEDLDTDCFERSDVVCAAIFHVTHLSNYNLARLKLLNELQIDAVISFLRYVRDNSEDWGSDADEALRGYWETPDVHRKTVVWTPNKSQQEDS